MAKVPGERAVVAAALEEIRRHRGLRRRDVARAMGMSLRTYENFESGRGPMTYGRLAGFAAATNCDLAALLLCQHLGAQIAIRSADNKAVSIALGALEDIVLVLGEDLQRLTAGSLTGAFEFARAAALASPRAAGSAAPLLAPRQVECLRWVQAGKSSGDIGAILGISPRTVDDYIAEACARLGVRTRVQAISRAIALGLLSP